MKKLIRIALLAVLLHALLTVPLAGAADSTAPAGSATRGKDLYMKHVCYSCHGSVGQGAERTGPKLAPNPFPYAAFAMQMREPRDVMPRYPEKFVSEQDLADIYAYMASIPAASKDASPK